MTSRDFIRLDGLAAVPDQLKGGVVAIGNFDGCHRGHQRVFSTALAAARRAGVPTLVLTFEPHPRDVFAPKPFLHRLTGPDAKVKLVAALGFDAIAIMEFSRQFAGVEAHDFVTNYLVDALGVREVVIGADFQFGKGRAGTPEFLTAEGERLGFAVTTIPMLDDGEEAVSSSRIRSALASGNVAHANALLGYHHFFSGVVERGDQRGRELNYPTANIAVPETFGIAQGVYAVRVKVRGRVLGGVAAFGKPMFDNTSPPFEAHIFDFSEEIYGEEIEIALIDFLRGQMTFSSLQALTEQMDEDSVAARAALSIARPLSPLDAALGFMG